MQISDWEFAELASSCAIATRFGQGAGALLPGTDPRRVAASAQTPQTWHGHMLEMAQRHADAILMQKQIEAQQAQARYYKMLQRTEAARQAREIAEQEAAQDFSQVPASNTPLPDNLIADASIAPVSEVLKSSPTVYRGQVSITQDPKWEEVFYIPEAKASLMEQASSIDLLPESSLAS